MGTKAYISNIIDNLSFPPLVFSFLPYTKERLVRSFWPSTDVPCFGFHPVKLANNSTLMLL